MLHKVKIYKKFVYCAIQLFTEIGPVKNHPRLRRHLTVRTSEPMGSSGGSKADENKKFNDEVKNAKEELHRKNHSCHARQGAASTGHIQEIPGCGARVLPPSRASKPKLYSDAVKGNIEKRYKITVKAKDHSQSSEQVKTLLKKNINPTGIKVGSNRSRPTG
ncbi:hypothetical protein C0J52_11231 [Blattella germanica]|nr:hypothetical protein C0J52_11231 [Blattella germanica]